jgi:hypothetical protein
LGDDLIDQITMQARAHLSISMRTAVVTSYPCAWTCYPHTKWRSIRGWWNGIDQFNNLLRAHICQRANLPWMDRVNMGCSTTLRQLDSIPGFHCIASSLLHIAEADLMSSCQTAPCWTEPPLLSAVKSW